MPSITFSAQTYDFRTNLVPAKSDLLRLPSRFYDKRKSLPREEVRQAFRK